MPRSTSRIRILDGAAALLEGSPWGDFTVDNLSRSIKMSKSTMYKHFFSKETIVDTLVNETCDRIEQLLQPLATDPTRAADGELLRFVEFMAQHAEALPRAVLIERRKMPSSVQARLLMTRVNMEQTCLRILRLGQEQGTIEVDEPVLFAPVIVSSLETAQEVTARQRLDRPRAETVRMVASMFLMGLGVKRGESGARSGTA